MQKGHCRKEDGFKKPRWVATGLVFSEGVQGTKSIGIGDLYGHRVNPQRRPKKLLSCARPEDCEWPIYRGPRGRTPRATDTPEPARECTVGDMTYEWNPPFDLRSQVRRLRARAEELRLAAETSISSETRAAFLRLAAEYDGAAE
jgi:hypothetical protein